MRIGKVWSQQEINYLEEKWGVISITGISKNLGRSVLGVKEKAYKLGLGTFINQGDYITFHQLITALGLERNYGYLNMRLERDGFPVKYKTIINDKIKIVYINDFWKWTKENQNKIDFSNFEENLLGPEEEWVKLKRRLDKAKKKRI